MWFYLKEIFSTYQNDPFFQEEEHKKSKTELTEKNDSLEASVKHLNAKLADEEEKKKNLEIKNSLKVRQCLFLLNHKGFFNQTQ